MLTEQMKSLYDDYYKSGEVLQKRKISAVDTVRVLREVCQGYTFGSLLDVGAGDGSVLREVASAGIARQLYAVEISRSGLEVIQSAQIPGLEAAMLFDGYQIPFPDRHFDAAMSIYVLEHVDHERTFLRELARVANWVIVAVPLEHTRKIAHACHIGKQQGHINFYCLETFRSLLETSGLEVVRLFPYATSREYEQFLAGRAKGAAKFALRHMALRSAPKLATRWMTYQAIALCRAPRLAGEEYSTNVSEDTRPHYHSVTTRH